MGLNRPRWLCCAQKTQEEGILVTTLLLLHAMVHLGGIMACQSSKLCRHVPAVQRSLSTANQSPVFDKFSSKTASKG